MCREFRCTLFERFKPFERFEFMNTRMQNVLVYAYMCVFSMARWLNVKAPLTLCRHLLRTFVWDLRLSNKIFLVFFFTFTILHKYGKKI